MHAHARRQLLILDGLHACFIGSFLAAAYAVQPTSTAPEAPPSCYLPARAAQALLHLGALFLCILLLVASWSASVWASSSSTTTTATAAAATTATAAATTAAVTAAATAAAATVGARSAAYGRRARTRLGLSAWRVRLLLIVSCCRGAVRGSSP